MQIFLQKCSLSAIFEYRMRGTNGNNESAFRGFRGFRTRNKSTELIQPFCG